MSNERSKDSEIYERKIISEKEHEKMHENNYAHVHVHNHGTIRVRVATEEEIKRGIRCIDEDNGKGVHYHRHLTDMESDNHEHTHIQPASGAHSHTHDKEHTKKILNRFKRAKGHMESVMAMIERGDDCSEVLIQLSAVKAAINNIGREILKEHVAHCVVDSIENRDEEALALLNSALDQFMK